jgi:hypothetical protein
MSDEGVVMVTLEDGFYIGDRVITDTEHHKNRIGRITAYKENTPFSKKFTVTFEDNHQKGRFSREQITRIGEDWE